MTEKLIAAAIIRDGVTYSCGGTAKAHWEIRNALDDPNPQHHNRGDIEGFETTSGRFVDRREAVAIGLASGQLPPMWRSGGRDLLSSDINW